KQELNLRSWAEYAATPSFSLSVSPFSLSVSPSISPSISLSLSSMLSLSLSLPLSCSPPFSLSLPLSFSPPSSLSIPPALAPYDSVLPKEFISVRTVTSTGRSRHCRMSYAEQRDDCERERERERCCVWKT